MMMMGLVPQQYGEKYAGVMLVQVMQIRAELWCGSSILQPIEPRPHDWAGFEATLVHYQSSQYRLGLHQI